MTQSIRTEDDLRSAITAQADKEQALAIGAGIMELLALGFGWFDLYDWQTVSPGDSLDGPYRWSASARRWSGQVPPGENLPERAEDVRSSGATPTEALASLLSEARTKAAPK